MQWIIRVGKCCVSHYLVLLYYLIICKSLKFDFLSFKRQTWIKSADFFSEELRVREVQQKIGLCSRREKDEDIDEEDWATLPLRMRCEEEPTVPYSLPLLFMATNSSLFTPYRLTTPRSTAEISIRPEQKAQTPRYNSHQSCSTKNSSTAGVVQGRARCGFVPKRNKNETKKSHIQVNQKRNVFRSNRSPHSTGQNGFRTSEEVGVKISCSLSISVQAFVSRGYFTVSDFKYSK